MRKQLRQHPQCPSCIHSQMISKHTAYLEVHIEYIRSDGRPTDAAIAESIQQSLPKEFFDPYSGDTWWVVAIDQD